MAWTKVQPVAMSGARRLASVRLKKRRVDCLATLTVRVSATIVETIGAKNGDQFDVLMGSGEHAGKLRLEKNAEGTARATVPNNKNIGKQFAFYLGHIKGMPDLHMDRAEVCFAAAVNDGIELRLPDLLAAQISAVDASDVGAASDTDDDSMGPKVDLQTNHLAYAGQRIEVGKRVAALLDLLAAHFGKAVRKNDLIKVVWGEETEDANYYNLIKRANDQINPIGLEVYKVRTNGTAACMLRSTGAT